MDKRSYLNVLISKHSILDKKILEYQKSIFLDNLHISPLKKEKLTTRDSRAVERKKYGHRKARRSFQFSKR